MEGTTILFAWGIVLGVALCSNIFHNRSKDLCTLPSASKEHVLNDKPWKAYATWANELGPIFLLPTPTYRLRWPKWLHIQLPSRPVLVITGADVALDLLTLPTFASKPRWPMAELLGRTTNLGFQYYGPRLNKGRRILKRELNEGNVRGQWGEELRRTSMRIQRGFAKSPESFFEDVTDTIQSLIVRFTYGREPTPEYVALAKEVMEQTGTALQPGRWAVNFIPALMYVPAWFPGAGFQRWARDAKDLFFQLTREPFKTTKAEMLSGRAKPSFIRHALEASDGSSEEESIIMGAAGSLFAAGSDTVVALILQVILLLLHHPDVQARAHTEILSVVGTQDGHADRLPTLQDRDRLPYIDCIIKEALRFHPVVPLVSHANSEAGEWREDRDRGEKAGVAEGQARRYKIEKGTWIMANVWAMMHDETDYPEPDEFKPERFLPSDDTPMPRDPTTLVFGFGRRICPGMHFAQNLVFLVVARMITCFEVMPRVSASGEPVLPPLDFSVGVISYPKPFPCEFKVRERAAELLAHEEE